MQSEAPSLPIARGLAGPGLQASRAFENGTAAAPDHEREVERLHAKIGELVVSVIL